MTSSQHDVAPMTALPQASAQDGSYPRPQLMRSQWLDLSGRWDFAYDDDNVGFDELWAVNGDFPSSVTVPFPPEATLSGIGDKSYHPVIWYRKTVLRADLEALRSSDTDRFVINFGAVDYRADVWVNGHHLGAHEGGHTPFSMHIPSAILPTASDTDALASIDSVNSGDGVVIVVRAEDDPHDVGQPRGKQDWQPDPHGIWYHRTTGIWQPVWVEAVPRLHVAALHWTSDIPAGTVTLELGLSERPHSAVQVDVDLTYDGEILASTRFSTAEPRSSAVITIPRQANGQGYEAMLWSPDHPRLIDASIKLTVLPHRNDAGGTGASDRRHAVAGVSLDGHPGDRVSSYLGLRSVSWSKGHFMLNDRPCYLRAVLAQGYWPESHLAAPTAAALEAEARLAKDMGFNTVRLHQKVEDPRFLFWADKIGLMVWGENASNFEFSTTAVTRLTHEWAETIERDRSHPSIIAWVPLNESWGVQHLAHDPAQLNYTRGLYHLTKALDGTRPVISNDGWEHADSDIWTIHDYSPSGPELAAFYADTTAVEAVMQGVGPLGRRMKLTDSKDTGQPIIVSEFGGISYAASSPDTSWGYVTVTAATDYEHALREQFQALQTSPVLAGFCYTQLTDTLQEANGLANENRAPKLPLDVIRAIVLGDDVDVSSHRRPKTPVEQPTAALSDSAAQHQALTHGQEIPTLR